MLVFAGGSKEGEVGRGDGAPTVRVALIRCHGESFKGKKRADMVLALGKPNAYLWKGHQCLQSNAWVQMNPGSLWADGLFSPHTDYTPREGERVSICTYWSHSRVTPTVTHTVTWDPAGKAQWTAQQGAGFLSMRGFLLCTVLGVWYMPGVLAGMLGAMWKEAMTGATNVNWQWRSKKQAQRRSKKWAIL